MFDVVVIGSANLDLVATASRIPKPGETVLGTGFTEHAGGKGLNQAVAAARSGAHVAFVGAFGDDDAGRHLRGVAHRESIDLEWSVTVDDQPTGRALITVDTAGENSRVVIPGANAAVEAGDPPLATVVLAQLEVPISAVVGALRSARAAGQQTILNPAPAPLEGLDDELLALCDVLIPNEHELELLGGVDALLASGVTTVITTRGAAGVTVVDGASGQRWHVDAFAVDPIDTTGAGDAFCGAFAARRAAGDELRAAVRYAAAAGALATTVQGAAPSLPHHDAVEALLAAR